MQAERWHDTTTLILSLLAAIILAYLPLPDALQNVWPHWVFLILANWALMMPQRVGLGMAFCVGVFMDVALGTPLGANALSLVVGIYFVAQFRQQVLMYPLWQQALLITLLVLGIQAILFRVNVSFSRDGLYWSLLGVPITSGLLWPLLNAYFADYKQQLPRY